MPATSRLARNRAAVLVAFVGAALLATAAPATATEPHLVAGFGGGYLARQLDENGGFFGTAESPDIGDTANAVLALHATDVGRDQAGAAADFLSTQLGAPLHAADGDDDPALLGVDIMAAVAEGRNPRRFGGVGAQHDLVTRLIDTQRTTGTDAGLFGTAAPTFDGAFRQGIALSALAAAGVPATTMAVRLGAAWLRDQQCANGLWQTYRPDTTAACPAPDPVAFTGPDTNSTGMAVQGLAAYHQFPRRATMVGSLNEVRSSDGGWSFLALPDQPADPDSTALGIQALLAVGSAPGRGAFTALASFQLGCTAPADDRGAFVFPGSTAANLLATVQAVPAAAGKTLPLRPSVPSTAVPTPRCDSVRAG